MEELLARYLAADDEDAMAELVRRTRPRLLAAARRICAEEAEDCVQTAYLSLVKKREPLAAPVLAWLTTVVVRVAYRRRAKRAREHEIAARLSPAPPPQPAHGAMENEEAALLAREVWKLPVDYRDALQLHYLHGLSIAETARLLDLNESTLRTRLHRGRKLLRSRLARVFYPLAVLPWMCADAVGAAAVILGGTMKTKVTVAAVVVLAFALVGYVASRERSAASPRADPPSHKRATAGSAGGPAAPEDSDETVDTAEGPPFATGMVVDTAGNPIPDARVIECGFVLRFDRFRDPAPVDDVVRAAAPVARTDASGRFDVARVRDDIAGLLFLKEGFAAAYVETCKVLTFDRSRHFVETEPKSPDAPLRIVLTHARVVSGVVQDSSGRPLAQASVSVHPAGRVKPWQFTRCDEEGRFELRHAHPELSLASAFAPGYHEERIDGPRADTLTFRLKRRTPLVHVRDAATGAPIANARATVTKAGATRMLTSMHPNGTGLSGGNYVMPGIIMALSNWAPKVDRFEVDVHVYAPGYRPVVKRMEVHRKQEPPLLEVALAHGEGTPVLAGRVHGAPQASVKVYYAFLTGRGGARPLLQESETRDGRFAFSGLPPGKHVVAVAAPGRGTVTRTVTVPATDLEFELVAPAALEVRARDAAGRPVAGTVVHVETIDGKRFWKKETGADGVARFAEMAAGEFFVVPVIKGWDQSVAHRRRSGGIPLQRVELAGGRTARADVTVPERVPFRLVVKNERGRPRAGLKVGKLHPHAGFVTIVGGDEWRRLKETAVETDGRGAASLELYEGRYEAHVADGGVERVFQFGVAAARPVQEVVFAEDGPVVKGSVREFGSNAPLAGIKVVAYDRRQVGETTTAADGTFVLKGLPASDVSIVINPRTPRERAKIDKPSHAPAHRKLDLNAVSEAELDVVLPRMDDKKTCELAVAVSREGRPVEGATVRVRVFLEHAWVQMEARRTDRAGRCVVAIPPAKLVDVRASAGDGTRAETEVERTGARTEVELTLAR